MDQATHNKIVSFIWGIADDVLRDLSCSGLGATISRIESECVLLRECRIRLIADVVTGKFDVREAAKRLPVTAPDDVEAPVDSEATEFDKASDELAEAEA